MIKQFEYWFKSATKAQRVHEDETNELNAESVIIDARLHGHVLSRDLQRAMQLENAPKPGGPGPSSPGLGSSSGGGSNAPSMDKYMTPKPPTTEDK